MSTPVARDQLNSSSPFHFDLDVEVLPVTSNCDLSDCRSRLPAWPGEDYVLYSSIPGPGQVAKKVGWGRLKRHPIVGACNLSELVDCIIKPKYDPLGLHVPSIAYRVFAFNMIAPGGKLIARINEKNAWHRRLLVEHPYFVPSQIDKRSLPFRYDIGTGLRGDEDQIGVYEYAPERVELLDRVLIRELTKSRLLSRVDNPVVRDVYQLRPVYWAPGTNYLSKRLGLEVDER